MGAPAISKAGEFGKNANEPVDSGDSEVGFGWAQDVPRPIGNRALAGLADVVPDVWQALLLILCGSGLQSCLRVNVSGIALLLAHDRLLWTVAVG